jgi:hypothetical protein
METQSDRERFEMVIMLTISLEAWYEIVIWYLLSNPLNAVEARH